VHRGQIGYVRHKRHHVDDEEMDRSVHTGTHDSSLCVLVDTVINIMITHHLDLRDDSSDRSDEDADDDADDSYRPFELSELQRDEPSIEDSE